MTHTLYIVGTPIGNLEDITPRALDVLRQVGVIASENPSRTQRLLARYGIKTPMRRFTDAYDRKKASRLSAVLDALDRSKEHMIRWHLRARGIRDPRVLQALRDVPREEFVQPEDMRAAYADHPLYIGSGQTICRRTA